MGTGLRAIMVSVNYTDLLSVTLPYNRHHFDEVMVVTDESDYDNLLPITDCVGARLWATDAFTRGNAHFNKWSALEEGLDVFGRQGILCIMDADVLWPNKLPNYDFEKGKLYTPLRRMAPWPSGKFPDADCPTCRGTGHVDTTEQNAPQNAASGKPDQVWVTMIPCPSDCWSARPPEGRWWQYPIHRNINEWAGYTQIFHADDPVLGKAPWHEVNWKHAGGADSFFQLKWSLLNKVRPSWDCLHLGEAGTNWMGRATTYADGTVPEGADQKRMWLRQMLDKRREVRRRGEDQFAGEKLGF